MLRGVRSDLTPDDLADFLELPIVAVFATYRRDGTVLLSPVWHEWRDGGFSVVATPGDVKVRNITRDPRAGIVVAESEPPYRGIEVRCTPTVSNDEGGVLTRRLCVRYLGETRGPKVADDFGPQVHVRLRPETPRDLRAWDFEDDYPPS